MLFGRGGGGGAVVVGRLVGTETGVGQVSDSIPRGSVFVIYAQPLWYHADIDSLSLTYVRRIAHLHTAAAC